MRNMRKPGTSCTSSQHAQTWHLLHLFLAAWRELAPHRPGAWLQVARLELDRGRREAARQAVANGLAAGGEPARQAVEGDDALRQLLPDG